MATITNLNKIVDVEKLSYFKNKQDTANKETFVQGTELESKVGQLGFKTEDALKETFVEQVSGKGLSTNDYDATAKAAVDSLEATYAKKSEIPDDYLTDDDLEDYAKSSDIESEYVKKDGQKVLSDNNFDAAAKAITDKADETYATKTELGNKLDSTTAANTYATKDELNKIGTVKGNATKSQLPTLAETANLQDIWCITDDNNHWYMFVGKGATGADSNGFVDLGDHIDISGKLDTSVAEQTYTKKADLVVAENTDIDALFS